MGRPTSIPPFKHKASNSSSLNGIGWVLALIVILSVGAAALGMFG